jgi:transporter family protein
MLFANDCSLPAGRQVPQELRWQLADYILAYQSSFSDIIAHMSNWLLPAFFATILWGFWAFLPKVATNLMNAKAILFWEEIGALIAGIGILFFTGVKFENNPKAIFISMLIGAIAILAELFYLFAIKKGRVGVIAPLTALYPLVAVILAFIILKEPIGLKQAIAILLALTSIVLLST